MKLSDLKKFLLQELEVSSFKDELRSGLNEYQKAKLKRGSSIPIYVIEDEIIYFRVADCLFLCKAYLNDELNSQELSYISDVLLLSNNVTFESDLIMEAIENLTDNEWGCEVSKQEVNGILKWLNKEGYNFD